MVPMYAGNKNVMQQGANNATIPPINAAVIDIPVKSGAVCISIDLFNKCPNRKG